MRVFLANVRGLRSYQPRRFDGVVTLFRTRPLGQASEDLLLDRIQKWWAEVDVYDAPGTHMALMLDPRLATLFAPSFEASLDPDLRHAPGNSKQRQS